MNDIVVIVVAVIFPVVLCALGYVVRERKG